MKNNRKEALMEQLKSKEGITIHNDEERDALYRALGIRTEKQQRYIDIVIDGVVIILIIYVVQTFWR